MFPSDGESESKINNSIFVLERSMNELLLYYYKIYSRLRSRSITLLGIFNLLPSSGFYEFNSIAVTLKNLYQTFVITEDDIFLD